MVVVYLTDMTCDVYKAPFGVVRQVEVDPKCVISRWSTDPNKKLIPAANNTVFESKIMSRNHGVLQVQTDPTPGLYYIDTSKYGTFRNGKKLAKNQSTLLQPGDMLRFGEEVFQTGSDSIHQPVKLALMFELTSFIANPPAIHRTNHFEVPNDVSDVDVLDNADLQDDTMGGSTWDDGNGDKGKKLFDPSPSPEQDHVGESSVSDAVDDSTDKIPDTAKSVARLLFDESLLCGDGEYDDFERDDSSAPAPAQFTLPVPTFTGKQASAKVVRDAEGASQRNLPSSQSTGILAALGKSQDALMNQIDGTLHKLRPSYPDTEQVTSENGHTKMERGPRVSINDLIDTRKGKDGQTQPHVEVDESQDLLNNDSPAILQEEQPTKGQSTARVDTQPTSELLGDGDESEPLRVTQPLKRRKLKARKRQSSAQLPFKSPVPGGHVVEGAVSKPRAARSSVSNPRRTAELLRGFGKAALTATAYATVGSLATIGFLASPLAERLAGL